MIKVNIEKAKEIAHEVRRQDRADKLAPLDIQATIPSMATEAEAARAAIRATNASVQAEIDAVTGDNVEVDGEEVKAIVEALESL